jgi:hypothetical protein
MAKERATKAAAAGLSMAEEFHRTEIWMVALKVIDVTFPPIINKQGG